MSFTHDRSWQDSRPSRSEDDSQQNASGWQPDFSKNTPARKADRDAWGDGAWDRQPGSSERALERRGGRDAWGDGAWDRGGSSRGRQRVGRQGTGNNWGRERAGNNRGGEGSQRWPARDGPASNGSGSGSGRVLRDALQGEAVYGVNPVLGALQALRREVYVLYVQESA
jgi:hypothetical protein